MLRTIDRRWPIIVDSLWAVTLVGAATLFCLAISFWVQGLGQAAVYSLIILLAALIRGLRTAIIAALLSVVALNFFVAEPRFVFQFNPGRDFLTVFTFGGCAILASYLVTHRIQAEERARRSASRLQQLLDTSRKISSEETIFNIAAILRQQIIAVTGDDCGVWLADNSERLEIAAPALSTDLPHSLSAVGAAIQQCWPDQANCPHPLNVHSRTLETAGKKIGLLVWYDNSEVQPRNTQDVRASELVPALGDLAAAGIVRARAVEDRMTAEMRQKAEELRNIFLASLSHDLRTPLSSILAAATGLIDHGNRLPPATQRDMLAAIREESERLNRYFGAILDLIQMESGGGVLHTQDADLIDIVQSAIQHRSKDSQSRNILPHFPPSPVIINTDPLLLEQALVNLIDNAVKYCPGNVFVTVENECETISVKVRDEGQGIPPQEIGPIFGRFFRGDREKHISKGHGLGLAICRAIIGRLGGQLQVFSPPPGQGEGSEFSISFHRNTISA